VKTQNKVILACLALTALAAADANDVELAKDGDTGEWHILAGPLVEKEERLELVNTGGTRVCNASGRFLYSYNCSLEELEADETIYRGGREVASADGQEYCASCRQGAVVTGDSNSAYLLATNASAYVRCVCGYR
jgi:hypothetical protein